MAKQGKRNESNVLRGSALARHKFCKAKFGRVNSAWFRDSRGFTLVEMLAVIFIISLLSTLLIANYRRSQKQYALEQAAQKLVSNLRRVQAMAMSGQDISPGGVWCYGLYIKKGESGYTLFKDLDGDFFYDKGASNVERLEDPVTLPSGISAVQIIPTYNGLDEPSMKNTLHICFASPDPTTYINKKNDPTLVPQGIITLQHGTDTSLVKTITINLAGAVKAE